MHYQQCAVDILKNGESFTSFDILTNLVFLQFINNLFGNHLEKVFGMLDPYLFGRGSTLSSYKSRFLHQLKRMWSAAKAYHHEVCTYSSHLLCKENSILQCHTKDFRGNVSAQNQ